MLILSILTSCNLQTASNVSAMENVSKCLDSETSTTKIKENIAKAATPEQQKEIAQDFCSAVKGYWDNRDIDFHTKNESRNSDEINAVYENFFDGGVRTY